MKIRPGALRCDTRDVIMRPVRSHSDLPSASGTLGKRMGGLVGGSLADFHIPAHLLTDAVTLRQASSLEHDDGCSEYEEFSSSGSSPLLAFINPKSGDGVSMLLGAQLRIQLGSGQVCPRMFLSNDARLNGDREP